MLGERLAIGAVLVVGLGAAAVLVSSVDVGSSSLPTPRPVVVVSARQASAPPGWDATGPPWLPTPTPSGRPTGEAPLTPSAVPTGGAGGPRPSSSSGPRGGQQPAQRGNRVPDPAPQKG